MRRAASIFAAVPIVLVSLMLGPVLAQQVASYRRDSTGFCPGVGPTTKSGYAAHLRRRAHYSS